MTDSEKLDLLLSEITGMKSEMQSMKSEIRDTKEHVKNIELHLENVTDYSVWLLTENQLSLVDKLNETVKAADKTAIYEIRIRMLTNKVDKLSNDVAKLKQRVA